MIALDNMRFARPQQSHDIIVELVFENRIAKAQQLIDIAHGVECQTEALKITMQIRYDPNPHSAPLRIGRAICDG